MAPSCEFQSSPTNFLRRLRVESLSLWCSANFKSHRQTICGDCACQIALAAAPCELQSSPTDPQRRLCVSNRSRCGAVRISKLADKPAEIVLVESLSLWRRANFKARRQTCGDCACRIALAVALCEPQSSPKNPLRRLCVSNRSRSGAVRVFDFDDEPFAEIARVASLSLWFSPNLSKKVAHEARSRSSGKFQVEK